MKKIYNNYEFYYSMDGVSTKTYAYPVLIKRSEVQKDCDFLVHRGMAILTEFQKKLV